MKRESNAKDINDITDLISPTTSGSLKGLKTLEMEGISAIAEPLVLAMGPTLRRLQMSSVWDSLTTFNYAFPLLKSLRKLTFSCDATALAPPFSFASLPPSLKSLVFDNTPLDSFAQCLLLTPLSQRQITITKLSMSGGLSRELLGAFFSIARGLHG